MIDAHQHFWRIDRGDYSWMSDKVAKIRRDILPPDLESLAPPMGITGSVAVQAAPTVAETEFLLSLAADHSLIKGVVGWVDLDRTDTRQTLERLAGDPKFKGIRPMLQDIEQTDWVLEPNRMAQLKHLADLGLRLDALIQPRHLPVIENLAKAIPDLPIVIDHCAKPVIAGGTDPGPLWCDGMSRLADLPNVTCKLSGLANEHGPGWGKATLQPVYSHVLAEFGPERLMWGSDWPVLEMAGDYPGWLSVAQDLTASLADEDKAAVFGTTAVTFYGLEGSA